jgi:hypothetical protein
MVSVEQWHIDLIRADGFARHFLKIRNQYDRGSDAFNWLNDQYRCVFGQPRYASYESFKAARSRVENS